MEAITFQDYLVDRHAEQYQGLDDEMPDNYEKWLQNLDVDQIIFYANHWHDTLIEKVIKKLEARYKNVGA